MVDKICILFLYNALLSLHTRYDEIAELLRKVLGT